MRRDIVAHARMRLRVAHDRVIVSRVRLGKLLKTNRDMLAPGEIDAARGAIRDAYAEVQSAQATCDGLRRFPPIRVQ